MRSTTSTYKQIIASDNTRQWLVRIEMTLADATELVITDADIMQGTFKVMSASSSESSFDIGSAVIGKCQFTLDNFNDTFTGYDFFNATAVVWVKLVSGNVVDTEYHRLGFFTVDEPQAPGSLIQLELLDNMWKLDVPLSEITLTYPCTILSALQTICTYCGVTLQTTTFHGYNYQLTKAPEKDMNCREFIQYCAMIGCNFCIMDDQGYLELKWYDTTVANAVVFDRLKSRNVGTDEITITGVKFVLDNTDYKIGTDGYVLTLENPLVDTSNVSAVLNLIWDILEGFKIRTFNLTALPDITPEVGDYVKIAYKNGYIYSNLTNFTFTPSLVTALEGAITPTRSLTKRYSKTVQAAVEIARKTTDERISAYDLAVQTMNNLAIHAMGAYQESEDLVTGGRVYYLSNKPITKDAQGHCTFTSGSSVFKTTGEGLFVSTDGGQTWTNGYNAQTGELIVNVLYTIGLHADWIYTGELTVGGSNVRTTNPTITVKDANNVTVCTINSQGIIMGSGYIASSDFEDKTPVDVFSLHGMKIDVNGKYIKSPHFGFNENGAYLDGEIEANSGHIGGAVIDQHSLTIRGDIELYSGSSQFRFTPYDYRLAEDFYLKFEREGNTTVTVTLIEHKTSDTTIGTYTLNDDDPVLSARLDHTLGMDNNTGYYQINISGGSASVVIDDAILAYMGEGGFRGVLQGIFEGYLESNSGIINGLKYSGGGSFYGSDLRLVNENGYSNTNAEIHLEGGTSSVLPTLERTYNGTTQEVSWGNKQNPIQADLLPPSSAGVDGDLIISGTGNGRDLYRYETNQWVKIGAMPNITITDTDPGEGVALGDDNFILVYE